MTIGNRQIAFSSDVGGRANNMRLPKTQALWPLFEAIINALQAIEDRGVGSGSIHITVLRSPLSQSISSDASQIGTNISGFIIEDDGIGFNTANLESFCTADSTLKISRGNKGIGRFLWLKAYSIVKIDSIYQENNSKNRVVFDFDIRKPYIFNLNEVAYAGTRNIGTKITLNAMKMEYVDHIPKTARGVGRKIVEHLLSYYATNTAPEITIQDVDGILDLKSLFSEDIDAVSLDTDVSIYGQDFKIRYLKNRNISDNRHTLHLCANKRDVKSEPLEKYIPDLKHKLGGDNAYVLQAYVQSDYLDKRVNQERSQFDFSDSNDKDIPSLEIIVESIVKDVKTNFADDIGVLKLEKSEKIHEFVATKAPKYRPLMRKRYEYLIDGIPPNLSDEKLEIELHRALSKVEVDIKLESATLLAKRGEDIQDMDQFRQKYLDIIERLGDVSMANLAQHVIHRMMIIDLLEASLQINDDGRYFLEESIHKIVHPLNTSSDQIHEEHQNLWLIDEKLAYHNYLASDKKLKSMPVVETESGKEPDLLGYFDTPHAFAEGKGNFQSMVIVEFKRPGRDSYSSENSDPIRQVYNYVDIIRSGEAKDFGGRPIPNKNIPIYAYVICDFTSEFRRLAKSFNNLQESYDGLKYFGYNAQLGVYVEAISFNALIEEARQRNRVFFDKLGLPVR